MSQPQLPLPLNRNEAQNFSDFIGSQEVVQTLENTPQLPQFTFIWGDRYAGKTLLVSALVNALKHKHKQAIMLDAAEILNHDLVNYLLVDNDFLVVEDVCQFAGNQAGETAVFNLYNACLAQQKKLIVTSTLSQRSAQWQLPDLRSRLNAALTLSLEVLKGEAAIECIKRQFAINGMPLDEAVINYLKTTQNTSLANLYPLFEWLASESLKLKQKVTIPLIKKALLENQDSVR